jgi:hypothetical protein
VVGSIKPHVMVIQCQDCVLLCSCVVVVVVPQDATTVPHIVAEVLFWCGVSDRVWCRDGVVSVSDSFLVKVLRLL